MADKYARVNQTNYTFRGTRLGRGTIVKCTPEQIEAAKDSNPPRLVPVDAPKNDDGVFDIRPKTYAAELRTPETGTPPKRAKLADK